MSIPNPLLLIGGTGSPYTRKMVALLRYRRIPYRIIWGDPAKVLGEMGIEKPKPGLLPTFLLPNENEELAAITDSTPIIRRLEKETNNRSVIPKDPALAFINYLLEDFGDLRFDKILNKYELKDLLSIAVKSLIEIKNVIEFNPSYHLPTYNYKIFIFPSISLYGSISKILQIK